MLNRLDSSQHSRCKHVEAPGLMKLDLPHNAERCPQADGHHGCVFEDVVLLSQDESGNGQSKERGGGVDHLCKGQLDVVQTHVSKGDAGTKCQAQQEHLAFCAGSQVPLCSPSVTDDLQFDEPIVHHYGCQHVQR